jgi:serine protease Do
MQRRALIQAGVLAACPALAAHAALPDVVARVKPSIAIVGTLRPTDAPRFRLRGTGFVAGNGNWVVTNFHVLPPASEAAPDVSLMVQVLKGPGREFSMRQATVLETDPLHDLAVLRVEGPPLPALEVGDSDQVREGQSVAFMGFPIGGTLGFSPVTHRGIVSAITPAQLPASNARSLTDAAIRAARAGSFDLFQLDATAYPGNSGGPLFDADTGAVLGVLNMVLLKNTRESALSQPSGISYAVPSKFVRALLERIAGR